MSESAAVRPILYNVREVAEQTRLSQRTVYDLIATGKLASCKIGASRRVPAEALDAFVAGLMQGADNGSADQ